MKNLIAVLLLFGVACFTATFSVVRAEKPIPISEQLGLHPVDPTPIAVALVSPDAPAIHAKNVIEPKDWRLSNAKFLSDDSVLELYHDRETANRIGYALSSSFPIQPGCYFFQIDQKTITDLNYRDRSLVTVGNASYGFFHDSLYADRNPYWMTFSHFFRIPETENKMLIGIKSDSYMQSKPAVHVRNIHLLPAQALLNLAPEGKPMRDIYWKELAVSRAEQPSERIRNCG